MSVKEEVCQAYQHFMNANTFSESGVSVLSIMEDRIQFHCTKDDLESFEYLVQNVMDNSSYQIDWYYYDMHNHRVTFTVEGVPSVMILNEGVIAQELRPISTTIVTKLREIAGAKPPVCEWDKGPVYCKPYEQWQETVREAADIIERYEKDQQEQENNEPLTLDGRLVVLPCKVGDTVWVVWGKAVVEAKVCCIRPFMFADRAEVRGNALCTFEDPFYDDGRPLTQEIFIIFGKDAFLTREEAEAALVGKGGVK